MAATRIIDVPLGALAVENPNVTVPNTNDMTISAAISNGGLTKNNNGKLELTGNSSYAGATTVNGGTLLVDGSQPNSAVTVNSPATLGGTGTTGPITNPSGLVSPGDPTTGIGTVSVNGNASFGSGGSLNVQLSGSNASNLSADLVNVSGALTLGGTSSLTVDLSLLTTTSAVEIPIINYTGKSSPASSRP